MGVGGTAGECLGPRSVCFAAFQEGAHDESNQRNTEWNVCRYLLLLCEIEDISMIIDFIDLPSGDIRRYRCETLEVEIVEVNM